MYHITDLWTSTFQFLMSNLNTKLELYIFNNKIKKGEIKSETPLILGKLDVTNNSTDKILYNIDRFNDKIREKGMKSETPLKRGSQ